MNNEKQLKPYIGMPVTYCIGSDRYAGEIKQMMGTKFLTVICKGLEKYPEIFSLRKNGQYRSKGTSAGYLILGEAREYMDPHF